MRIKTITFEMGNDFRAIYECEHCGVEKERYGYHDNYFHTKVVPGWFCGGCWLNRAGQINPDKATMVMAAAFHANAIERGDRDGLDVEEILSCDGSVTIGELQEVYNAVHPPISE